MALGNGYIMLSKTIAVIAAIALGLYGAWWGSSLVHYLYLEDVGSFDELTSVMQFWFMAIAAVLTPALIWLFLRTLRYMKNRFNV